MTELIILFFIELEVAWDWYHEIKKGQSPNYAGSNLLRAVVLFGIILIAPWLKPSLSIDQWWFITPMALLNFWFLFSWHLNLARTWSGHPRPYWYLGDNSKLDKWQKAHGGAFRWFWIKLTLAIVSILIFEIGPLTIFDFVINLF